MYCDESELPGKLDLDFISFRETDSINYQYILDGPELGRWSNHITVNFFFPSPGDYGEANKKPAFIRYYR